MHKATYLQNLEVKDQICKLHRANYRPQFLLKICCITQYDKGLPIQLQQIKIYNCITMNDQSIFPDTHKIKIHLIFHHVQLTVKFHCNIVLALKNYYNKIITETTPKALSHGRCEISQQIIIDWEAQFNPTTNQYLPSSMEISVLIHATNGVIHAGLCTLDVTKSMHHSVFRLKKCSDKTATLTLTSTPQYSQKLTQKSNKINTLSSNLSSTELFSLVHMRDRKLNRFKKEENRLSESKFEQSVLSISKISVISNKKLQNILRAENQELSKQNDELRSTIKWLQRKEKQNSHQLKECLIKIQKITGKCNETEGLNQLNQMLLIEKEKCLKSYESQINRLEERNKNYFEQINALEAKIDIKEDLLQKQMEKYSEKILKLEEQLQKVIQSYAAALNKYEQYERTTSHSNKQKQKSTQLQRARNNKQIKQLQEQLTKIQEQRQICKAKICQLEGQNERVKNSQSLTRQLTDRDQVIKEINEQLVKIKRQKKQIQQELHDFKSDHQDRLSLKKRIAELQSQCNQYRIQIQKISHNGQRAQSKFDDLSIKIDQLQKENKSLDLQLQNSKTEFNLKNNQLLSEQKQNKQLKDQLEKLQGLIYQYKLKTQEQQATFTSLKQQIQWIESEKQMLKYQRLHLKQQLSQMSHQNEQLKQKINALNERHQVKNKQMINYECNFKNKQAQILLLQEQVALHQNKQKKYEQSIIQLQSQLKRQKQKIQTIQNVKIQNQQYQNLLLSVQEKQEQEQQSNKTLLLWLLTIIQSDKPVHSNNMHSIHHQFRQNLIKSIEKRNMYLEKRSKDYEAMVQQKHFIQNELEKLGKRLYQCEQFYEEELMKVKSDRDAELKQFVQQKNKHLETIIGMESERLQLYCLKERYYKDNKLLEHRVQASEKDIQRLKNLNLQLEQKIKIQHQNLLELTNYYQNRFGQTEIQQRQYQLEKENIYMAEKQNYEVLVETLKDIINNKQEQIKKMQQKIDQIEENLSKKQSENKKTEFDLSVQKNLLQELQMKFNSLTQTNNELRKQMSNLQREVESKTKTASQKQIDIQEYSAKSIEISAKLEIAQQTITQYQKEKNEFLQKANEQIGEWKYKLKVLEQEYNGEKKQFEEQKERLIHDVQIYKILIQQAENTIDRLQKENERLLQKTNQSQIK